MRASLLCSVGKIFHCVDYLSAGPRISWLLLNRVMRIMFELNTEELGGEGCIMWSFIICTACEVVGYQRTLMK